MSSPTSEKIPPQDEEEKCHCQRCKDMEIMRKNPRSYGDVIRARNYQCTEKLYKSNYDSARAISF